MGNIFLDSNKIWNLFTSLKLSAEQLRVISVSPFAPIEYKEIAERIANILDFSSEFDSQRRQNYLLKESSKSS